MHWPFTLSSEPGRGSILRLSVPLAMASNIETQHATATAPDTNDIQQLAVLFVDDDQLVRNATLRLLTSWNVAVQACSSGDEALAILNQRDKSRRWRVLLDYRLADADNGILLAERIRLACGDNITFFLMTAETDEQILADA